MKKFRLHFIPLDIEAESISNAEEHYYRGHYPQVELSKKPKLLDDQGIFEIE